MDPLSIVLIVLGIVAALIGGIVLLVAAFQQNVWWGLASIFLPLASLVFVICHWSRAKTGFLISMAGSLLLVGGCYKAAPQLRELLIRTSMAQAAQVAQTESKSTTLDLAAQVQQKRGLLERREAQFVEDGAALTRRFAALTARRKSLKNDDAAAVAEFNTEAAAYQTQNAARKIAKQELDAARQELEGMLDQRARQGTPEAATAKPVVMYTTATCPACTAAKSYMARKGIKYQERDVNTSPEARADFQRLGGRGVPLIMVGTERMEGFSAARLDQML